MSKFLSIGAFIFLSLAPNTAKACECITIEPSKVLEEHVSTEGPGTGYLEFFAGTVIDVRIIKVPTGEKDSFQLVNVAQLMVDRLWLGKHQWRKTVYTSHHGTACGIDFKVGEKYLIQSEDDHVLLTQLQMSEIESDAIITNRCVSALFDKNDAAVIDQFDKEWKPWIPTIKLDNNAP